MYRIPLNDCFWFYLRRLLYISIVEDFRLKKSPFVQKISTTGKPAYSGSPFSERDSRDCKIRSLSMSVVPHVFTSFARLKKSSTSLNFFFSPWRMMTLVLTKHKGSLLKYMQNYCLDFDGNCRICYELGKEEEKDNVMENSYTMFQIREAAGRSQMFLIGVK